MTKSFNSLKICCLLLQEVLEWLVLSAVLYLWRPGYVKAIRVFELTENAEFSDSDDTPQED